MDLHCIIIEDEPLAAEKLQGFISQVPFLITDGYFENAITGLQHLKSAPVDLVFLDIQMDKLTGLQMLEMLNPKPYVIITTAYPQYALKGYELCVTDYLLKPYSFERFLVSVNRIYEDSCRKNANSAKPNGNHIFVRSEYRLENVCIDDIYYIEGMQSYLKIFVEDRKIMTKQSLKSMLDQLPASEFIQVHKSYIVHLSKIKSVENNRIRILDQLIPIGDSYKQSFYDKISKPGF
jgi:DNA-binding LytR/AlgR family response regulator